MFLSLSFVTVFVCKIVSRIVYMLNKDELNKIMFCFCSDNRLEAHNIDMHS